MFSIINEVIGNSLSWGAAAIATGGAFTSLEKRAGKRGAKVLGSKHKLTEGELTRGKCAMCVWKKERFNDAIKMAIGPKAFSGKIEFTKRTCKTICNIYGSKKILKSEKSRQLTLKEASELWRCKIQKSLPLVKGTVKFGPSKRGSEIIEKHFAIENGAIKFLQKITKKVGEEIIEEETEEILKIK